MPFTTGVHIAAGYVQERQGVALLSIVTNSITSTASTGVTDFVGPSGLNPPAGAGSAAPAFEVSATVDTFVAVGAAPDAVNGPRMLVRAGTDRPMFCKAGDKLAWAAA